MWKYGQSAFATSCGFFRATFDNGLPIDSLFAWLVQKKKKWLLTVYDILEQYTRERNNSQKFGKWKIRVPHRRRCWKICRSGSQQKHSKKDAQRRSIDEVVFAKWKRNMTTPRHTAARIRCLPQQISIACEKKVRWWIWANNTQRNLYRFCGALSENPTLQRVYYRRTTFDSWIVREALV